MSISADFSESVDTCVVLPCFNEAARLRRDSFLDYVRESDSVGLIFVDDGSTDGSAGLLRELCDCDPERMALLALPANQGKAEAVRRGLREALEDERMKFVGYWDADLATPLHEIDLQRAVLVRRASIDVVLGIRSPLLGHHIRRGRARALLGRAFALAVSLAFGRRFRDTQCGAKLFRVTRGLRAAVQDSFQSTWIFDIELVLRCRAFDGEADDPLAGIHEQPVEEWTARGSSKVKPWTYGRAILDLPLVWLRTPGLLTNKSRPALVRGASHRAAPVRGSAHAPADGGRQRR